ncbi:MAG: PEP/pyruvate-binding domain-containing protein [Saprospiraceae bacterium]
MKIHLLALLSLFSGFAPAQIPISSYTLNSSGQAQIEVSSSPGRYYVLHVRHGATDSFTHATTMAMGKAGTTLLTDPLAAYPPEQYRVTEHLVAAPADTDGDGYDDMEEFNDLRTKSPFNTAQPIDTSKGLVYLTDRAAFEALSYKNSPGIQNPNLQGIDVVKFFILDKDSDYPQLYFIDPVYNTHTDFAHAIGAIGDPTLMTGLLIYHPTVIASNGTFGTYRFNFQPHNVHTFPYVQKVAELLAANVPFLKNNLCYYPYPQTSLPLYFEEKELFDASRVCVLFDDDIYGNVNYLAFNLAEGYGILRQIALNEVPGSRDLVVYESLPNELPRVGGIITTVTQTPLSHVNLRAIQDNLPNVFIRDALQKPEIKALLGKYVRFKAEMDTFSIREASQHEVEEFYANRRPSEALVPVRDLSQTEIKPLDSISFAGLASFGVKCANVATMRSFGFPDGTIPDGFGIPFYFYDEFMKFNGFYAQAQDMLKHSGFQTDFEVQQQMLEGFREKIKNGAMPVWMTNALSQLQQAFPAGSSIRCRSSTNNEDLPGFSGAGLYDSRTQHPHEGHIAKSIRQIYASMWNYRAFDEREFYRVDHFMAAMGVLVHLNYDNERANGVGVSLDPIYQSEGTYYLNTQVGEDLVTNPAALSIPEEILLDAQHIGGFRYAVMQPSNQVPLDSLVLKESYLEAMQEYLAVIHARFQVLYNATDLDDFAMEIEYKVTAAGQLIVKQARPWVGFWSNIPPNPSPGDSTSLLVFPNPFHDFILIKGKAGKTIDLRILNAQGQVLHYDTVFFEASQAMVSTKNLSSGVYLLQVYDNTNGQRVAKVLVK